MSFPAPVGMITNTGGGIQTVDPSITTLTRSSLSKPGPAVVILDNVAADDVIEFDAPTVTAWPLGNMLWIYDAPVGDHTINVSVNRGGSELFAVGPFTLTKT